MKIHLPGNVTPLRTTYPLGCFPCPDLEHAKAALLHLGRARRWAQISDEDYAEAKLHIERRIEALSLMLKARASDPSQSGKK